MGTSNKTGIVISSKKGYIKVAVDNKMLNCLLKSSNYKKNESIRTGDIVSVRLEPESDIDGIIEKVHDRKNTIPKPFASNIDVAIIVASFRKPTFSDFFLSKVILYLQMNNIKPVILFTKGDLVDEGEAKTIASQYIKEGYEVFISKENEYVNIEEYFKKLKGKTILIMGRSGVGKSTLINRIFDLDLKTALISESLKRGKHTTTSTTGHLVKNQNVVIDSPGFETLFFPTLTQEELAKSFFSKETMRKFDCSFTTCRHLDKKYCKLSKHVDMKLISEARFDVYKRLSELAQKTKW